MNNELSAAQILQNFINEDEVIADKPKDHQFEGFEAIALRNAAMDYLVFPCDAGKKKASIKKFPELATSNDVSRIKEWAAKFPNASVGLLATPDGHLFIDEDDSETFRAGYGDPFPVSRTTESRQNHRQSHWLQTDYSRAKLRNIKQEQTKNEMFSLRFRNLYVLGEGSQHPSGSLYRVVVDAPAAPIPDHLVDYILSLVAAAPRNSVSGIVESGATDQRKDEDYDTKIPPRFDVILGTHSRNNGVSDYAWHCWQNEPHDIFEELVHDYNAEHCDPPLEDSEVEEIIRGKRDKPVTGANSILVGGKPITETLAKERISEQAADAIIIPDHLATSEEAERIMEGAPLLDFQYPEIKGSSFDYVIGPADKTTEGWFPRGDVSLIAGSSGANKSTFANSLLDLQLKQGSVLGHPTYGLSYIILQVDRGKGAHERTTKRMRFDPELLPVRFLPLCWGDDAIKEILREIERCSPIPSIVFIEGADMLVEDASKTKLVAPFLSNLQKIAQHYHIAILCSVGSGKQKIGEGYAAKRDKVFGSVFWGRMSETIAVLEFIKGDDTDARRTLTVLLRNGPSEKYSMKLENGRLVVDSDPAHVQAEGRAEITWFRCQGDWFTVADFKKVFNIGKTRAYEIVTEAHTKSVLKTKQLSEGQARQYKWNDGKGNPLNHLNSDREKSPEIE